MTDTLTLYIWQYNNKHNISQDYGQSVYVDLYSRFTWQCNCITYYIKKCHSWQNWQVCAFSKDLALTILTVLGGLGMKICENSKKYGNICFLCKHLIVLLITSIRISFLLSYLQSVILFCTLTSYQRTISPQAHLSAKDMLKSVVIEEKKFKHSPWAGADNSLGPKFRCQQEGLITIVFCCKFKKNLFNLWLYTHLFMI